MSEECPYVLVVDDEPHLCEVLQTILEKAGYAVETAPDGEVALSMISTREPDVIVLDLILPGIDGRGLCLKIRELSPATRIVYFTGKPEPMSSPQRKQLRREADGFIAKPATTRQILSAVGTALRASSTRG